VIEVWRTESTHLALFTGPEERVSRGPGLVRASWLSKEDASVLDTVGAPNEQRAKRGNNPAVRIQPVS
jgi:hypothetical protein